MPFIMIGLFIACAISSVLAPAFLAVATVSYWPLLFYAPYLITFLFFKSAPTIYS